jgi:hypothetical protein
MITRTILFSMKFCFRTISIFAAPLALVTVGAVLMVYAGAIQVAELQGPDDATGIFEMLKLSVEQAISNFSADEPSAAAFQSQR